MVSKIKFILAVPVKLYTDILKLVQITFLFRFKAKMCILELKNVFTYRECFIKPQILHEDLKKKSLQLLCMNFLSNKNIIHVSCMKNPFKH